MTKSEMEYMDWSLLGPAMLFLNQYFNTFINEFIVLWMCMVCLILYKDIKLYLLLLTVTIRFGQHSTYCDIHLKYASKFVTTCTQIYLKYRIQGVPCQPDLATVSKKVLRLQPQLQQHPQKRMVRTRDSARTALATNTIKLYK